MGEGRIRVVPTAKLLTNELRARLPKLYATEGQDDPLVQATFFYPDFSWTWYAIEFAAKTPSSA
jgi:hypothetical protein